MTDAFDALELLSEAGGFGGGVTRGGVPAAAGVEQGDGLVPQEVVAVAVVQCRSCGIFSTDNVLGGSCA